MPPGFEAKAVLGKGAMGIVYKAWQPKLQRHVAIKTCNIKESVAAGQDPARLEDEALTIARLNHPNIVSLYDVLKDDENIYLIMELLEGPPVSRFLNRKSEPAKLGPLVDMMDLSFSRIFKDEAACEVGIAVARALDYAHSRKILHRDVKPANIVITLDRHIKLLDFSIARDPHQQQEGRTVTGTVFGTVQYMSPEQILSNPLDGRTDVYALGCTLYHMVAGEVPFSDKNDITVCLNHVNDQPPDMMSLNPLVRPELAEIILKCMEKKPEDRFTTAGAVADALEELLSRIRKGVTVTPGAEYDINLHVPDEDDEPPAIAFAPSKGKPEPPPPAPSSPARRASREIQRPREEESTANREREKRRRDLSEIAAASDTKVPLPAAPPPPLPSAPPRADGRGSGSGSSAPWLGGGASSPYAATPPAPQSPAGVSAFDDTPVPKSGRGSFLIVVVGAALALLALTFVAVYFLTRPKGAPPPSGNESAAVLAPRPAPEPVATPQPEPTSTPFPTPTPVPTPSPDAPALPVPTPPPVDPAIRKFRVELADAPPFWMVEVPPGAFVIGSPFDEPGRREDEGPRTRVVFTRPWFLGETEVTRSQWRAIMGERSVAGRGDLPVTDVSWEEATEFCRLLSERTGLKFVLPTEPQWEYACRAETASAFAFGEIVTSDLANIDGTVAYPRAPLSRSRGEVVAVAELPPNAWGIFGMHGNVWEFTRDAYTASLPGRELTDPAPNSRGEGIAIRGGGFASAAQDARSAARMKATKSDRRRDGGLRLAVEL